MKRSRFVILPPIRQEVHLDIGVPRSTIGSRWEAYGLKDVDNQLMAHFVVPQLYLESYEKAAGLYQTDHHADMYMCLSFLQILTESCPGRTKGRSLRVPGLVGDITDIEGRSIFCDSKELEPAGGWRGLQSEKQLLDLKI